MMISLYLCYWQLNPYKEMPRKFYGVMLSRSLLGTGVFITFYYTITIMPLTLQMVIFQTSPFWSTILGVIFLHEKAMPFEYFSMLLAFGGVLFVVLSKNTEDS